MLRWVCWITATAIVALGCTNHEPKALSPAHRAELLKGIQAAERTAAEGGDVESFYAARTQGERNGLEALEQLSTQAQAQVLSDRQLTRVHERLAADEPVADPQLRLYVEATEPLVATVDAALDHDVIAPGFRGYEGDTAVGEVTRVWTRGPGVMRQRVRALAALDDPRWRPELRAAVRLAQMQGHPRHALDQMVMRSNRLAAWRLAGSLAPRLGPQDLDALLEMPQMRDELRREWIDGEFLHGLAARRRVVDEAQIQTLGDARAVANFEAEMAPARLHRDITVARGWVKNPSAADPAEASLWLRGVAQQLRSDAATDALISEIRDELARCTTERGACQAAVAASRRTPRISEG